MKYLFLLVLIVSCNVKISNFGPYALDSASQNQIKMVQEFSKIRISTNSKLGGDTILIYTFVVPESATDSALNYENGLKIATIIATNTPVRDKYRGISIYFSKEKSVGFLEASTEVQNTYHFK